MDDKYLFLQPTIKKLDQGDLLRSVTYAILNIAGWAALVIGIYLLYATVREGGFKEVVDGLIQFITLIVISQILFIRAKNIHTMGKSDFTAIPIAAVVLTIIGEVLATLTAGAGLSACLLSWIEGNYFMGSNNILIPFLLSILGMGSPFLTGILLLVGSLIVAFMLLVIFYLLSESTVVLVSIWMQLHQMNEKK